MQGIGSRESEHGWGVVLWRLRYCLSIRRMAGPRLGDRIRGAVLGHSIRNGANLEVTFEGQ